MPQLSVELPPLVVELVKRGVTAKTAAELVAGHQAERIGHQLEVFDWLAEKHDKRIANNPAGYLVKSIEDDYAIPKDFESKADRQKREEAQKARQRQAAEAHCQQREQEASEQAERKAIAEYWQSLTPEQQAELDDAANASGDPETLAMEHGPLKRIGQQELRTARAYPSIIEKPATCHS